MPARNSQKIYVKDGYYHIYNRGVEKRTIFQDDQDYQVFLSYLKEYLEPPPPIETLVKEFRVKSGAYMGVDKPINNYYGEIELVAYCLMPNHFHLLLRQNLERSLEFFMRSLGTRYTLYFNRRNVRVGHLFQSIYKAVNVETEAQLVHLSRYIHLNPVKESSSTSGRLEKIRNAHSSYSEYLGLRKTKWIKPSVVLSYFQTKESERIKINSYQRFVESELTKDQDTLLNSNLTIDTC